MENVHAVAEIFFCEIEFFCVEIDHLQNEAAAASQSSLMLYELQALSSSKFLLQHSVEEDLREEKSS